MRASKSGKEIVERLSREISRAENDLEKIQEGPHADWWRCHSAHHALKVMRQTNRLLSDLISEIQAPPRPTRQRTASAGQRRLPAEPV
jgi:hypothetical protein